MHSYNNKIKKKSEKKKYLDFMRIILNEHK